ncbi:MAG TPA: sulfatase [Verrucomicrobiaceae bacterium]
MKMLLLVSAFLLPSLSSVAAAAHPNILMIAIDDQNDWIGCLGGHPQAKTPHLDAIAARGTLFTNAHCQAPLCNPSRSSIMTGLRPGSTGVYGLVPGIRDVAALKDYVTLPLALHAAGYFTFSCGKVYHDGSFRPKDRVLEFDEWVQTAPGKKPPTPLVPIFAHPAMDWGPWPERDEDTADWKIADAAIAKLKALPAGKPFFIACGFRLPHVPCYAPQKWFDLYPDETLIMPPVKEDDRDDLPKFADFLHWKLPEPRLKTLRDHNQWRPLVRAYLASTSLMDSQVGRVMEALKQSGTMDNTIVIVWSDHGWHLGEKLMTGKNTLWERSTRVPFIWAGPGVSANAKCGRPAELLDIFPTLVEMLGLTKRNDLEGHSLVPQLKDAQAPREFPAITTHNQNNHGIRTEKWRYIRYADGSEELYDEVADPNEWTNLASRPQYAAVKKEMAQWLPKKNLHAVPGSAQRILTYDEDKPVWEDEPIDVTAPLPEAALKKSK